MGQKVSPVALRIGINKTWISSWYANKKDYGKLVVEDEKIRQFIKNGYSFSGIDRIEIQRNAERTIVLVYCAKPSFIIGRHGAKVDKLTEDIIGLCNGKLVDLKVVEVSRPELSAQLVAETVAQQLQKQAPHRRIMHKAIETVMGFGAQGIKIRVGGRIGGIEIARAETLSKGKIPLHTLRADIDYARAVANLSKGTVGVKVWIYKGEILSKSKRPTNKAVSESVPKEGVLPKK